MDRLKENKKYIIIGLAAGIINGLFGGGSGLILVPLLKRVIGLDIKSAHATAIAIAFSLSVISAIFYISGGAVSFSDVFIFMLGGAVGGAVGAFCLKKIPKRWLHYIFALFLIFSAVRMLLNG